MNIVTDIDRDVRRSRRRVSLAAAAGVVLAALLVGSPMATAAPHSPPDVPANIAVPAGHVLTDVGQAVGFQIYTCQLQPGSGFKWLLQQPQAVLQENGHKPFALHYGGPSWTAMADGSTVVATKAGEAPAPSGGTIPWLLLKASTNSGPEGGTFSSTAYIQRVNTTGGLTPTIGCANGQDVGAIARIPYTADYYFYRAI